MNLKLAFFTFTLLLSGCTTYEIKDSVVSDRVKACSAGFSEDLRAQLHAALNKMDTSAGIEGDFHEEMRAIIFAETPVEQHLEVYEDYIKCVEENWNVNKPMTLSRDPWDPRKGIKKKK